MGREPAELDLCDLHPGVLLFLEERKGWMAWGMGRAELDAETAAVYEYCRALTDQPEESAAE